MGVRIEHPQPLIDGIQYHLDLGMGTRPGSLPAARYRLATTVKVSQRALVLHVPREASSCPVPLPTTRWW